MLRRTLAPDAPGDRPCRRWDELAARPRALGMHAVALTDRDSLAGAVRFTQACARYGVKPIAPQALTRRRWIREARVDPEGNEVCPQ